MLHLRRVSPGCWLDNRLTVTTSPVLRARMSGAPDSTGKKVPAFCNITMSSSSPTNTQIQIQCLYQHSILHKYMYKYFCLIQPKIQLHKDREYCNMLWDPLEGLGCLGVWAKYFAKGGSERQNTGGGSKILGVDQRDAKDAPKWLLWSQTANPQVPPNPRDKGTWILWTCVVLGVTSWNLKQDLRCIRGSIGLSQIYRVGECLDYSKVNRD